MNRNGAYQLDRMYRADRGYVLLYPATAERVYWALPDRHLDTFYHQKGYNRWLVVVFSIGAMWPWRQGSHVELEPERTTWRVAFRAKGLRMSLSPHLLVQAPIRRTLISGQMPEASGMVCFLETSCPIWSTW